MLPASCAVLTGSTEQWHHHLDHHTLHRHSLHLFPVPEPETAGLQIYTGWVRLGWDVLTKADMLKFSWFWTSLFHMTLQSNWNEFSACRHRWSVHHLLQLCVQHSGHSLFWQRVNGPEVRTYTFYKTLLAILSTRTVLLQKIQPNHFWWFPLLWALTRALVFQWSFAFFPASHGSVQSVCTCQVRLELQLSGMFKHVKQKELSFGELL